MNLDIIKTIKETTENRRIRSYCNKILKKLSLNSSLDVANVTELTVLLYVFDLYDEAVKVAEILDDLEFTGNYTIWNNAEPAKLIAVKILRQNGEYDRAEGIMEVIKPHLHPELYENQRDSLHEFYDRNMGIAEKHGWKAEARDYKLKKLEVMLYFSQIPDFPMDKQQLEKDIAALKAELKTIVK